MTIELKPEQEYILKEALPQGRFQTVEEALDRAIQSIASSENGLDRQSTRPIGRKSLAQLFSESPFKGMEIEFERFPDTLSPSKS